MSELWVDTDLGFDDIHALLLLRCHHIQPIAHSLVFGCATLDQVVRNAQGVERAFDLRGIWYAGANTALDGQCRTAAHVLGDSGMQSRGCTLPEGDTQVQRDSAVTAMIHWLSGDPVAPQLLALGPLTNLAQLIVAAPDIAAKLTRITWMGGAAGRGNQTAQAEFNAWADAEAAAIVFQSGIRVHMVELEACRKLQLVSKDIQPLAKLQTPTAQLVHDLLGGYLDIGLSRGRSGMALYDPLAAAAVLLAMSSSVNTTCEDRLYRTSLVPELSGHAGKNTLSELPVHVCVDTQHGEQLGRTHIKPATQSSGSLHSLCVVNDVDAVHDMLVDALITTCTDSRV